METFFDDNNHPKIKLTVGGSRRKSSLEAILELINVVPVQYADGRTSQELVFSVAIEFANKNMVVPVTLTGGTEALAGTALFAESKLTFDFIKQKIIFGK